MARKQKPRAPVQTPAEARARAQRAAREGRYQQALELAKQVYKAEPTPANKELLFEAYLGRGRQLRGQGYLRDAVTVLEAAAKVGGWDEAQLGQIAEELAATGEPGGALKLLTGQPDSPARGRVLALATDAAVQKEAAGRNLLPADLRADFDRVLQAFAQIEKGQDAAARETLQAIGLRSPFLEWKVLLRGLLAYHASDDPRALENWQRLDPSRLPARLAAPLRFRIDPAFRAAQEPATQAALQQQGDRLQGQPVIAQLRSLQAQLTKENGLPSAFRQAESILSILRREAPHLIPRLATCFWWAIVTVGHPEDVPRHARVFGNPPDDPNLDRLRAMACEQEHDLEQANRCWQDFEKSVAANHAAWPDGQADHARALIWLHMGKNAAAIPDADKLKKLPSYLRDLAGRLPKPPKPPAEECFRRCLELAPDLLEAHQALFDYYRERDQVPKAIKAGREMVQRFPKNVAALESLADLLLKKADYPGAVELFGQALEANPLDRRLRGKLATARLYQARQQAEEGRFDEARAGYQVALSDQETGAGRGTVYCKWAACEFKAGEPARAEELLQKALAESGSQLAVAFSILIEVIRMKLPRTLKTRFDKEFKEALEEPATAASAVAVLGTAASHALAGVTYHGQITHEKKVLAYVGKVPAAGFTESELEQVCGDLLVLESVRLLRSLAKEGQRRFPANPFFPYVEAESYLIYGPESCPVWQVRPLLERAAKLAAELPPHDRHRPLLDAICERQQMIGAFDSLGGMFDDLFGGFWDDDHDDEDDYDDDGGW